MTHRRSRSRAAGQGMVEYAVALALIAIVVIAALMAVGRHAQSAFCQTSSGLASGGGCSVTAFGSDSNGQIGDGSAGANDVRPFLASQAYRQVSAGGYFSLGLRQDGTVWAWGQGGAGQLGQGSGNLADSGTPVQITQLSGISQVSAGQWMALALAGDGSVWAWGDDTYRQDLGTGAGPTPMRLPGLSGITQVLAEHETDAALAADGSVYVWGDNVHGEAGNGTVTSTVGNTPAHLTLPARVTALATDGDGSFALTADGSVYGWGHNDVGQAGVGAASTNACQCVTTPTQLPILAKVVAIFGGYAGGYAIESDGSVWGWGGNSGGQVGNGNTTQQPSPVQIGSVGSAFGRIVSISGGERAPFATAVTSGGQVLAWGDDAYGELGDGGGTTGQYTPTAVGGLTRAAAVSAGGYHVLVLNQGTTATG